MAKLSTAAWILHDLSLATAIGGVLFGQAALTPAVKKLGNPRDRDAVNDAAWTRFSWFNLAAHGVMAATWFAGRAMLGGREVSRTARHLTIVKDALVVTSLASVVVTKVLGSLTDDEDSALAKVVAVIGATNLVSNVAMSAVTTGLSMEASQSLPFSVVSRRLP